MSDRQKRGVKPYDGDLKNQVEDRQHGGETHPGRFSPGID